MSSITEAVTKKLKLFRRDKVATLIDGGYESLFQGKGVELDGLREYVVGDSIQDIDWASTARTGKTQTKLFAAARDQQILLAPDISKSLLILGHTGLNKRDALYGVMAIMGAFVTKNRDTMAVCHNKPDGKVAFSRYGNSRNHIESLLRTVDATLGQPMDPSYDFNQTLNSIVGITKKRSAIFIVTDGFKDIKPLEQQLMKLSRRHKLFFIQLAPSTPLSTDVSEKIYARDIEFGNLMPLRFLQENQLAREWSIMTNNYIASVRKMCRKYGIAFSYLTSEDSTTKTVMDLFNQASAYARRR